MAFASQPFGMGPFPFGFQVQSDPGTTIHVFTSLTPSKSLDPASPVTSVKQRIQIALASVVNSSTSRPSIGVAVPSFISPRFREEMEESIARALSKMLIDGEIDLVSVTPETEGSRARVRVKYRDHLSNEEDEVIA